MLNFIIFAVCIPAKALREWYIPSQITNLRNFLSYAKKIYMVEPTIKCLTFFRGKLALTWKHKFSHATDSVKNNKSFQKLFAFVSNWMDYFIPSKLLNLFSSNCFLDLFFFRYIKNYLWLILVLLLIPIFFRIEKECPLLHMFRKCFWKKIWINRD